MSFKPIHRLSLPALALAVALSIPIARAEPSLHVIDLSYMYPKRETKPMIVARKKSIQPFVQAPAMPALPLPRIPPSFPLTGAIVSDVFTDSAIKLPLPKRPRPAVYHRKVETSPKAVSQLFEMPRLPVCMDGKDNDGDGKIDYPEDPGCFAEFDSEE